MAVQMADLLFVYGTLMKTSGHPMAVELQRHGRLVGEAVFTGRLYRVEDYPGAVASTNPGDRVYGELYELRDNKRVLAVLDRYEGCSADFAKPTEYVRRLGSVHVGETPFKAWIYLYNCPVRDGQRIASGRFVAGATQTGSI
jgi:gamma-glutamylcyclotransferase (GGCT)/AIG2-like uncharacterized protein YtfP